MSIRVTVLQLQEQLSALLEQTVQSGEECIIQRNGEDYAVLVSAHEWSRRGAEDPVTTSGLPDAAEEARSEEIGRKLDRLGPEYRLSRDKQERMEALLTQQGEGALTTEERQELEQLVRDGDEIMLRRARAISRAV